MSSPTAAAPVAVGFSPSPSAQCTPQNNRGNFDLSSVLHVQSNYLFDVTNNVGNANDAPEIVGYVNDVQSKLANLSDKFRDANSSSQSVLSHQQQMLDIVNAEKARLEEKKQLIDNADMQKDHVMILNNTYRKKYTEYTKIVIVVVICVAVFILIRLFADFLQIPELVSIILHILNIVIGLIAVTVIYANVQVRSNIDFDKLELPPPNTGGPAASSSSSPASSLSKLFDFCFGENCCDNDKGVVWDPSSQMCVTKKVQVKAPVAASPVASTAPAAPVAPAAPTTNDIMAANHAKIAQGFANIGRIVQNPFGPAEPFEIYGRSK